MGTRFSPLSLHSMVSEPHQPISTFHLSLRADEYIYPSIFRDEIFPTQEIVLMWNIPHKEDNSGIRFYSYLEMPDRRSGRGPIQKRIQSIVALYPHFKSFLCRSQRGYNHMCLGVCLHTHTHTYPTMYQLRVDVLKLLPEDRRDRYRIFNFVGASQLSVIEQNLHRKI